MTGKTLQGCFEKVKKISLDIVVAICDHAFMSDEIPIELEACPHCGGSGQVVKNPAVVLKAARASSGLPLRTLAQTLNISHPYAADLENGKRTVTPERANQWLVACGQTTPWLKEDK